VDTSSGELNYMGESRREEAVLDELRQTNTNYFVQTWSRRSSQTEAPPFSFRSRHDMNFARFTAF
jgi:hypothetical protein